MSDETIFSREILALGRENTEKIKNAKVIVFGLGGVGSYCTEALARAGVGHLTVVDGDTVNITNVNRQLYALNSTVGRLKTEVAAERIRDINPEIEVEIKSFYYGKENADDIDFGRYDYVADAIDSVTSKILIAEKCQDSEIKEISCMGTGNKFHPEMLKISDIYKTSVCPLARVMRYELKKRGVKNLITVYSEEQPVKCEGAIGSVSFVPPAAGMMMAGWIIRDICDIK